MVDLSRRRMIAAATAAMGFSSRLAWAGPGDQHIRQGVDALLGGNQMSEADERRFGETNFPELINRFGGLYPNRRAQAALVRFATPLLQTTRRPFNWQVVLLSSTEVLGAALPGGKIALTRGLLTYLAEPWELAAVIAHEMGHAELSHHRDEMRGKQAFGGVVSIGAGFAAAATGRQIVADAIELLKGPILDIAIMGYSQGNEEAADAHILDVFARTGWPVETASHVFHRLLRLYPTDARSSSLFASHPEMIERITKMEAKTAVMSATAALPTSGTSAFTELKTYLPTRLI